MEELRTEDTEAYKELMRMNNKTFYEILTAVLAILPLNGFLAKPLTEKLSSARSNCKNCHQLLYRY